MARYGWRPRDFLVTPGAFGRFEEVQWRPLSGNPRLNEALPTEREEREAVLAARREVDRQRAARWQHSVAFQVRSGAPYRGLTLEDIAVDSRIGLDSLRRLLRGDGPMEVEDFATMQRLLGVRPFGVPSDVPRLAGTETEPE